MCPHSNFSNLTYRNLNAEEGEGKLNYTIPKSLENSLLKVLNLNLSDIDMQQVGITLIAKLKSENTLRLRKLEKAQYTPGEFGYKMTSIFAGMLNATSFDFRCIPGTTYAFEDSNNLGIPEVTAFTSDYSDLDVVICILQIKGFVYMTYFINNVYEYLVKRYKDRKYRHFDPTAQDMCRTLKIYDNLLWMLYRYEQFLNSTNIDAYEVEAAINRLKVMQKPFFTKIFDCLRAIVYKNEKMQKVMWKHKEFIVCKKRGLTEQFGELDVVSLILDNKNDLYKANDLDNLTNMVVERMAKENFEVVIEILAKISMATMNKKISLIAMDILTDGPVSEAMVKLADASPKLFTNFTIIISNMLKSNQTLILRNTIVDRFNFSYLYGKMKGISEHYSQVLIDRDGNVQNKTSADEEPEPDLKFEQEGFNFEYKFLKNYFEHNSAEFINLLDMGLSSLIELYNILYFNIFLNNSNHTEILKDIEFNFLEPMNDYLWPKEDQMVTNAQILLSRHLYKLYDFIDSYLNVIPNVNEVTPETLLSNIQK